MGKHLSFWIGFFAAALLIVPIAAGIMGVAEERLRQAAVFIFAGVSALVVVLVIALFFRDRILRRLVGRAETTLEEVSGSLVDAVTAASKGDADAAARHARALVQGGVGWYAWSNFYRWVIGAALGLLLAFGAFVGTVLLFEQTRTLRVQTERIGEQTEVMAAQTRWLSEQTAEAITQNEISTIELENDLRNQMLASIETRSLTEWLNTIGRRGVGKPIVTYAAETEACGLGFHPVHVLFSRPSDATLGAIANLAKSPALGERTKTALELLTQDRNGGVALGALLVLESIDQPYMDEVTLRQVMLAEPFSFRSQGYRLVFAGSYIHDLDCDGCTIHLAASVMLTQGSESVSGFASVLANRKTVQRKAEEPWDGLLLARDEDMSQLDQGAVSLKNGPFFSQTMKAWTTPDEGATICDQFEKLARINPMLNAVSLGTTGGGTE
ncbi:hypothetical protein [uncultured Tateyamaria sp.]|uniref:hypothetical protein n=1 Tax=uncultured Tateyamaria sp. TaxID=455651 RepID=UPI00262E15E9|nr:hypothetical protein [uncultured Tateyamaria sp.]